MPKSSVNKGKKECFKKLLEFEILPKYSWVEITTIF